MILIVVKVDDNDVKCVTAYAWLAQLLRSLPLDHKVPSWIPGSQDLNICTTFFPS